MRAEELDETQQHLGVPVEVVLVEDRVRIRQIVVGIFRQGGVGGGIGLIQPQAASRKFYKVEGILPHKRRPACTQRRLRFGPNERASFFRCKQSGHPWGESITDDFQMRLRKVCRRLHRYRRSQ